MPGNERRSHNPSQAMKARTPVESHQVNRQHGRYAQKISDRATELPMDAVALIKEISKEGHSTSQVESISKSFQKKRLSQNHFVTGSALMRKLKRSFSIFSCIKKLTFHLKMLLTTGASALSKSRASRTACLLKLFIYIF